jgi:hypothetical protein
MKFLKFFEILLYLFNSINLSIIRSDFYNHLFIIVTLENPALCIYISNYPPKVYCSFQLANLLKSLILLVKYFNFKGCVILFLIRHFSKFLFLIFHPTFISISASILNRSSSSSYHYCNQYFYYRNRLGFIIFMSIVDLTEIFIKCIHIYLIYFLYFHHIFKVSINP